MDGCDFQSDLGSCRARDERGTRERLILAGGGQKCGLIAATGKPGVGSRNYHGLVEFAVFGARKCELMV